MHKVPRPFICRFTFDSLTVAYVLPGFRDIGQRNCGQKDVLATSGGHTAALVSGFDFQHGVSYQ